MSTVVENTLIVLPAWNEEEAIGGTLSEILRVVPGARLLVVNDGSTDSTAQIARNHGVAVASFPFNLGVGAAMRFGFRYAKAHGFDNVIQLDSDGQHDPAYLAQLLEQLQSHDIVIGARFAGEGSYTVSGPRKWAMRMLSAVIGRTARTRLSDTTSGFRASGPRAVSLFANDYPAEYLGDTVESLVTALRSGLRVTQVPVAMRTRAGGQPSQSAWRSTAFLFRAVIALAWLTSDPDQLFRKFRAMSEVSYFVGPVVALAMLTIVVLSLLRKRLRERHALW